MNNRLDVPILPGPEAIRRSLQLVPRTLNVVDQRLSEAVTRGDERLLNETLKQTMYGLG